MCQVLFSKLLIFTLLNCKFCLFQTLYFVEVFFLNKINLVIKLCLFGDIFQYYSFIYLLILYVSVMMQNLFPDCLIIVIDLNLAP